MLFDCLYNTCQAFSMLAILSWKQSCHTKYISRGESMKCYQTKKPILTLSHSTIDVKSKTSSIICALKEYQ